MNGACAGDGCICARAGQGDEPTALAYTPDDWCADDAQVETVALAVESARRWAARRDLSADVRLRRMWTVLTTALEG